MHSPRTAYPVLGDVAKADSDKEKFWQFIRFRESQLVSQGYFYRLFSLPCQLIM